MGAIQLVTRSTRHPVDSSRGWLVTKRRSTRHKQKASKHQSRTAVAVITLSPRSPPLLKNYPRKWADNKVNNKEHALPCSYTCAVNSSQQWQHGVWGAGQLVTTRYFGRHQLVIRFWAVTSWPCDELTGFQTWLRVKCGSECGRKSANYPPARVAYWPLTTGKMRIQMRTLRSCNNVICFKLLAVSIYYFLYHLMANKDRLESTPFRPTRIDL